MYYLDILSASITIGNIQHTKCQSDLYIPKETFSEMFPMTIHKLGQYHHDVHAYPKELDLPELQLVYVWNLVCWKGTKDEISTTPQLNSLMIHRWFII